jgi:hypothetical protein
MGIRSVPAGRVLRGISWGIVGISLAQFIAVCVLSWPFSMQAFIPSFVLLVAGGFLAALARAIAVITDCVVDMQVNLHVLKVTVERNGETLRAIEQGAGTLRGFFERIERHLDLR